MFISEGEINQAFRIAGAAILGVYDNSVWISFAPSGVYQYSATSPISQNFSEVTIQVLILSQIMFES